MKGMATLEWIVIAAVVLMMVAGAVNLWQGAWGTAMAKATSSASAFESAMAGL